MHFYSHGLSNALLRLYKRKFGGVTPDILVDPQTYDDLRAEIQPLRRRFYLSFTCVAIIIGAALWWALVQARWALDGPAVNAVLDQRATLPPVIMGCGVACIMLSLIALAEHTVQYRWLGWDRELWTRYFATVEGRLPRRALGFNVGLGLLMAVPMLYFGWLYGGRVDDNGIAFMSGPLTRTLEPYSRVAGIQLIQATRGPNPNPRDRLRVTFVDGSTWEYAPDPRAVAQPGRVAEFIAAHTGIQVGAP